MKALAVGIVAPSLFVLAWGLDSPRSAETRLVSTLRAQQAESPPGAVLIREKVQIARKCPDGVADVAWGRIADALELQRDLRHRTLDDTAAPRDAHRQVDQRSDAEIAGIDRALLIARLNRDIQLERTLLLDLPRDRVHYADRDLRDLAALQQQFGFSELDLCALDQTAEYFATRERLVQRPARAPHLALAFPGRPYNEENEHLRLGGCPKSVLNGGFALTARETPGGTELVALDPSKRSRRLRLVLDERNLVELLERFDADGRVIQCVRYADYAELPGGLWVPLRFELTLARGEIADYYQERRQAISVSVIPRDEVPEGRFSIPREAYVQEVASRPKATAGAIRP